jgi:hypothetical protein
MGIIFDRVRVLVQSGDVVVSAHGFDELARDNIVIAAVVVTGYRPDPQRWSEDMTRRRK